MKKEPVHVPVPFSRGPAGGFSILRRPRNEKRWRLIPSASAYSQQDQSSSECEAAL
jgi:hypothetical protein